jgi:hypothetical protein
LPRRLVVVCYRGRPGCHKLVRLAGFHEEHALADVRQPRVIRLQPHLHRQGPCDMQAALEASRGGRGLGVRGRASIAMLRAWWPLTEPIRSKRASSGYTKSTLTYLEPFRSPCVAHARPPARAHVQSPITDIVQQRATKGGRAAGGRRGCTLNSAVLARLSKTGRVRPTAAPPPPSAAWTVWPRRALACCLLG